MPLSCQTPGAQPGTLHLGPTARGHLGAALATRGHTKDSPKTTRAPGQTTGQQHTEASVLVLHTATQHAIWAPKCLPQFSCQLGSRRRLPTRGASTAMPLPEPRHLAALQTELAPRPGPKQHGAARPPSRDAGGGPDLSLFLPLLERGLQGRRGRYLPPPHPASYSQCLGKHVAHGRCSTKCCCVVLTRWIRL